MISTSQTRSYSELITLPTFEERVEYLKLNSKVGEDTFGYDRYLNQMLYTSGDWRKLRNKIIVRDKACDLGVKGYDVETKIIIHHIIPITKEDILDCNPIVFDPNNLICCSESTHKYIHFGRLEDLPKPFIERAPGDTCPWRK